METGIVLLASSVYLSAIIAGVTEMLSRLRAQDYWVVGTIGTAAIIGLFFGLFGYAGFDPVTGTAAGFAASGFISALGANKSTPAPSKLMGDSGKG